MGPSTPGASSAVVGIPSTAYLPSLLNDPTLKALQGGDPTRMLSCLIHFTPAHVVADEGYRQWMASFGPQTTHILAGYPEAAHRSPFRASRLNNLRLNKLDACIFPEASSYTGGLWWPGGRRGRAGHDIEGREGGRSKSP